MHSIDAYFHSFSANLIMFHPRGWSFPDLGPVISECLECSLSHPYMATRKTVRTFVGKVLSLLFNMLSRSVIAFLPKSKHLLFFMAAVSQMYRVTNFTEVFKLLGNPPLLSVV